MSSNGGGGSQQLPPGWTREYSNSQKRHFYFHKETKHTQWHFPTASEVKDPIKAKRRAEMNKESETTKRRPGEEAGSGAQYSKRPRASNEKSGNGGGGGGGEYQPKKAAASAAASAADAEGEDDFLELADATSVAIIVPYRDIHPKQQRAAHLAQFVPHMHKFLSRLKQKGSVSDYHIYIVEQSDDGRKFNRGKLLNIGFEMATKHHKQKKPDGSTVTLHPPHDVFIFHDVDLLPADDLGPWYAKFPTKPLHIARVWDRYSNNPKYFGGIVSFSKSDYKRINGYPNTFWGWGGEDDEMQNRLERLGIVWESPPSGSIRDLENMTLPEKLDFLRQNKSWKCMVKWEALKEHEATWKTNGLNSIKYELLKVTPIDDTGRATRITADVQLNPGHWANDKAGMDYMPDWKQHG